MKTLRILFTLFLVSLAACSKQPVTEQSVSQESEPPLVLKSYATVFGATVEGDHTVVGLYDVYKTEHGHRRLLTFSCDTKTGKPRIYDTMYPVLWRRKPEVTSKLYSNGVRKELKYEIIQVDQIKRILESIEKHPFSRRHYLSNIAIGLNPEESVSPIENVENGRMALDTCHQVFYLNVRKIHPVEMKKVIEYRKAQSHAFGEVDSRPLPQYRLDSMLQMRSNDVMVGKPHNIAQYSALTFIIAHVLNLHPGHYTHSVNDSHVYLSHHKEALEQLTREPYPLPKLYLSQALTKEALLKGNLTEEMFQLVGYQSHGFIKLSLEG